MPAKLVLLSLAMAILPLGAVSRTSSMRAQRTALLDLQRRIEGDDALCRRADIFYTHPDVLQIKRQRRRRALILKR